MMLQATNKKSAMFDVVVALVHFSSCMFGGFGELSLPASVECSLLLSWLVDDFLQRDMQSAARGI